MSAGLATFKCPDMCFAGLCGYCHQRSGWARGKWGPKLPLWCPRRRHGTSIYSLSFYGSCFTSKATADSGVTLLPTCGVERAEANTSCKSVVPFHFFSRRSTIKARDMWGQCVQCRDFPCCRPVLARLSNRRALCPQWVHSHSCHPPWAS